MSDISDIKDQQRQRGRDPRHVESSVFRPNSGGLSNHQHPQEQP
jgi:hypothetical protein